MDLKNVMLKHYEQLTLSAARPLLEKGGIDVDTISGMYPLATQIFPNVPKAYIGFFTTLRMLLGSKALRTSTHHHGSRSVTASSMARGTQISSCI
jgi:hypothetical protein